MNHATTVKHRLVLLVLATTVLFACAGSRSDGSATGAPSASPAAAASVAAPQSMGSPFLGTFYPPQGHTHLNPGEPDDFVYNSNPPTSGPHREMFNDAFISPTPLPKYLQVHLLEHGNVLLQYDCNCSDVAVALGAIAMQYDKRLIPPSQLQPSAADVQNGEDQGLAVIVAPYPHMKSRIAVTAWTRLGTLQSVDRQKIVSFINAYLHNAANAGM